MAKEFALHQTSRDGAAVHIHQGTAIAGAAAVDRACYEFLPRSRFPVNEHGRIRGGNLIDGVERLEECRTIAHDLLEVVLRAQFLLEINVFLLQPCLQAVNFLVGLHILNCQCDLVRHFLQEHGFLVRIPILFPAYQAERADTLSLEDQGQDTHRLDTLCDEAALIGILPFFFKIAAQERLLMVEHPAGAGLIATVLQPRSEVVREQISLHGEEAESISIRFVEGNGTPVERDETMQSLGNRVQEGLLGQVRNDGIVDLKQAPVPLFAFAERRLRLFPLRDVDERYHRAQGSTFPNDRMRPILCGKARAIPSPKNLIVSVDALAFLKAHINRAFFKWIWGAVFSGMVLQRMHVFPD